MFHIIGVIIEWMLKYTGLGVLVALGVLVLLMILISERERVRAIIKIKPLEELFDQLCEISDRRDAPYAIDRPYGSAMWVTSLIWKGLILEGMILVLWGFVRVISG